jgi:hypothetical protein
MNEAQKFLINECLDDLVLSSAGKLPNACASDAMMKFLQLNYAPNYAKECSAKRDHYQSACDHDWEDIGSGKQQCTYPLCQKMKPNA